MGFYLALLTACLLAGCAPGLVRNPVPANATDAAVVEGLPAIRYWGDEVPANIDQLVEERLEQMRTHRPELYADPNRSLTFLALSGGGEDGAFGAGLLNGWTARGDRPEFEVVTGISTGALIAPLAFLGSAYDDELKAVYTSYETSDLITPSVLSGLLGGVAITESSRFESIVAAFVTPELLRRIAAEHLKGRRLLIGTTDLDAQRPVVWDMGRIALSGRPDATELFRKVLLASAAIPGVFPPVFIDVEVNGVRHEEMHVDGGTMGQVFFLPPEVIAATRRQVGKNVRYRLFVINNGRIDPQWQAVEPNTFAIAKRSLYTLIKSQGLSNLAELHDAAERSGVAFNLAAIPPQFDREPREAFDRDYMRALFAVGYAMGVRGGPWLDRPRPVVASMQ